MSEKSVQFKSHGLILSWYVYTIYRYQDQLLDKTRLKFRQSITLCDIATVKEWVQTFLPLPSMTSLKPVNDEILHNLPSSIDVPFIKMMWTNCWTFGGPPVFPSCALHRATLLFLLVLLENHVKKSFTEEARCFDSKDKSWPVNQWHANCGQRMWNFFMKWDFSLENSTTNNTLLILFKAVISSRARGHTKINGKRRKILFQLHNQCA